MITINLLGENKVHSTGGKLFLYAWGMALVGLIASSLYYYQIVNEELASATDKKNGLETQVIQLRKITKDVKDLENLQKELIEKITVIAKLRKSKRGPVRVLDDLNVALPEKAWLDKIEEKDGAATISGIALDNTVIAEFLKSLEESKYFEKVELGETKNTEHSGLTIKSFKINAQLNYSGINIPENFKAAPVGPKEKESSPSRVKKVDTTEG